MKGSPQHLSVGEVAGAGVDDLRSAMKQRILFLVCEELGVTPLQVLCQNRTRPLPMARQLVAWLMWNWEGFTMQQAADLLGVNVSTVGYYVHNVESKRKREWATICRRLAKAVTS